MCALIFASESSGEETFDKWSRLGVEYARKSVMIITGQGDTASLTV